MTYFKRDILISLLGTVKCFKIMPYSGKLLEEFQIKIANSN